MELSRSFVGKSTKYWNPKYINTMNDGLQYENLTFTMTNGMVAYGNGTTMVDFAKSFGTDNTWNQQAYTTTGYAAPFTVEYVHIIPDNATDSGRAYSMISLNSDPTTDPNYTSLDWAGYPYVSNNYYVYNNGTAIATGLSHSPSQKYYIVYAANGYIYHYNGSSLLYSVNTASSTTLRYIDTSHYGLGEGFRRVRGIKKEWNGQAYV